MPLLEAAGDKLMAGPAGGSEYEDPHDFADALAFIAASQLPSFRVSTLNRAMTRISTRSESRTRQTREHKRAANRQRLLDAAREVFSDRGYHEATIEEIAAESGLSNGAVYYNFRNKEDLFLALLDQRIEARIAAVERTFGSETASDEESASRVRTAAMEGVRDIDDPREWAMFFEFVAHAARAPAFRREFRKRSRRMRTAFARAVERRSADLGADLPLPAEQVGVAIAALTHGLAAQRVIDPRAVPDELLGQLVIYLLRGMAASGGAPAGHPATCHGSRPGSPPPAATASRPR